MNHRKSNLPSAIQHKLRAIQRRQMAFSTVRGIAIGLGMLSLGLVGAMAIDWIFVLFGSTTRTLLTCATVGTSIAVAVVALVGPLRSAWDIRQAARSVDSQVPNLQQRWTTVASFSQPSQSPTTTREQRMQEQVSSEAVAMHSMVNPSKLAPLSLLGRPLWGLTACVLALVGFMAIYPLQTRVLWNRFWSPTQDITATQLMNENSLDFIPRGERVELAARQQGVPRSVAELTLEYPSGQRQTIEVPADSGDALQFVHTMRADESIRYRMRAGDGQTPWRSLKVIDYPEIGEVQFKIASPAYVGRPDDKKLFIPRRIKVIQGSTLQLAIRPPSRVGRLVLMVTTARTSGFPAGATSPAGKPEVRQHMTKSEPSEQVETIELEADADGWYHYEHSLHHDMIVEPKLWSEHGLQNEGRTTCRIETIADAAPVARVIRPTDDRAVADDEIIEIQFEAHDDHGIAKAELVIYDDSQLDEHGQPKILETREIPLGDQVLPKHWIGQTTLDLKDLMLKKDAQISYAIRVTDNRDVSPESPADRVANVNPSRTDKPQSTPRSDSKTTLAKKTQSDEAKQAASPNDSAVTKVAMKPAASRRDSSKNGQNTETKRRRLRITERLQSIAGEPSEAKPKANMRDRIVQIDKRLATSENTLQALVDHSLPDSSRGKTLVELDIQIGAIQEVVADLRSETRTNEFAFVGLQMVDLSRFQITPARDRVFSAKRRPGASDRDVKVAFGHITHARKRLAKLLKRYDRVQRDRGLQKTMEESITMYEVYVQKSHVLLREAVQNRNPLTRRMSIHEVDQDYLDRLAEVQELRRQMMNEFGEMLGDDPRLMSRYMDLIRRRNSSLRDRLSELAQRQDEATVEMQGWIEVDEQQRSDLWSIVGELRLGAVEQLAIDVANFAELVTRRMPLVADADRGIPAQIIGRADAMTQAARLLAMDSKTLLNDPTAKQISKLQTSCDELVVMGDTMESALNQMQIDHEEQDEISNFIASRLLETRAVRASAEAWSVTADHLYRGEYAPLASLEQHVLAIDTESLRVDMLSIQSDLGQQFRRQGGDEVPDEVIVLVERVQQLMSFITLSQVAATIASGQVDSRQDDSGQDDLEKAARQQQAAMDRFNEAEQVLDQLRRTVVAALDEYDEPDLNIADLRDPTLDEFLARLEREPGIVDRLGLSRRRRNVRINVDSMLGDEGGAGLLSTSLEAAQARIAREMANKQGGKRSGKNELDEQDEPQDRTMTNEERQRIAEAKSQQQEMEKMLLEIEAQAESSPQTSEQQQRLKTIAKRLREIMESSSDDEQRWSAWQQIIQADQAKSILAAARQGTSIPDEQWNKIASALEDGLWQVRGKKPPEEYRKAIEQYQDSLREWVGP